ncbi:putative reverse transcriptase zinc-binding domain-containing protein [Rosa chinensis]|uniref:Putative reverse transcriptase zinc-binding domain-containing protein n=1 Tax=Rosa chinensis TaxID=74649 RepID=A0A2P6QHL9_ROSCH|nr:putative reverse transcriptase zinc-binding domain-containing protein [Rosa chinensis]
MIWVPIGNGKFTIKSASNLLVQRNVAHSKSKLLMRMWKTNLPSKVKVMAWQMIRNRLSTRDRVFSNLYIDRSCSFCDSQVEDLDHLFLHCPFTKEVWKLTFPTFSMNSWNQGFVNLARLSFFFT